MTRRARRADETARRYPPRLAVRAAPRAGGRTRVPVIGSALTGADLTGATEPAAERLDRLSGGQRQRCRLAMVLAQHTSVILPAEPTSALDAGHAIEVLELLREVAAAGRTVVMVQHDLAAAARYADMLVANFRVPISNRR